jgi:hypothetical protein
MPTLTLNNFLVRHLGHGTFALVSFSTRIIFFRASVPYLAPNRPVEPTFFVRFIGVPLPI